MIKDVEAWRTELLVTGNIVQDEDTSVSQEEREWRFIRYLELVAMVTGEEEDKVFRALIDSIQARHDYGAYQSITWSMERFPARAFGLPFLETHVPLITRDPDWAGDLLLSVVADPDRRTEFNNALAQGPSSLREAEMAYILTEEQDGWLVDHANELRPAPG